METALMSQFGRKATIAAVAFATVGSTLFGGAALANDDKKKDGKIWKAGDGGPVHVEDVCNYQVSGPLLAVDDLLDVGDAGNVRTDNDIDCSPYIGGSTGGSNY
jgi:hypothetical protein